MNNAIEIRDITFAYGQEDTLRGVTASLAAGRLHALFGPNGSGKSTLLRCLAGLLRYQVGSVQVLGREVAALSPRELARLVAYVPQEHRLSFPFTVREVVLMGRTPHLGGFAGPSRADKAAAARALATAQIEEIAEKPYTELSGGQRQLVLLARALCQDAPVLVLDEPTSALDFKNQMLVWQVLGHLREEGRTVVACTHDPNHVSWFCDEAAILRQGRLLRQGPVEQVMDNRTLSLLYGGVCELRDGMVQPAAYIREAI